MRRQVRFGTIEVEYDGEVLEPRPWTVEQARWAVELLDDLPEGPVLELCSGAGQIGLVAAVEAGRSLVQVDTDPRACGFARANAARAGVDAEVRCGDLQEALHDGEAFPLVLADPPYVPSDEVADLEDDPDHAVDGGADGLDIARTCLAVAGEHVLAGGAVLLQLGSVEQAEELRAAAAGHHLHLQDVRAYGDEGVVALLRPDRGAVSAGPV